MSKPVREYAIIKVLRRTRYQKRLTQTELARKMGYSRASLTYWETSQRLPTLRALDDWCQALGVKSPLTGDCA